MIYVIQMTVNHRYSCGDQWAVNLIDIVEEIFGPSGTRLNVRLIVGGTVNVWVSSGPIGSRDALKVFQAHWSP